MSTSQFPAEKLTEKRSADRQQMANEVIALAEKHGFTTKRRDQYYCGPREITVEIETRHGLCLNLDFDGLSCQPDVFVLSWHFNCREHLKLSPGWWKCVNTALHLHYGSDFSYTVMG